MVQHRVRRDPDQHCRGIESPGPLNLDGSLQSPDFEEAALRRLVRVGRRHALRHLVRAVLPDGHLRDAPVRPEQAAARQRPLRFRGADSLFRLPVLRRPRRPQEDPDLQLGAPLALLHDHHYPRRGLSCAAWCAHECGCAVRSDCVYLRRFGQLLGSARSYDVDHSVCLCLNLLLLSMVTYSIILAPRFSLLNSEPKQMQLFRLSITL